MDTLKIAICEDSAADREHLLERIRQTGFPVNCTAFTDGESFLQSFRAGQYDAVFMDIYMGGITGVDTITAVRRVDGAVPAAFTTTSRDHTLEGYRLDVLKYMEKPITEKDVRDFLQFAKLRKENMPRLHLQQNGQEINLPFSRILFAEQKGHELLLHLTDGKTETISGRLDLLEPQFDGQNFLRCHKSYLVNLIHIRSLNRTLNVFVMDNGENVHIRRESLSNARKAYEAYLFTEARRSAHAFD